MGKEDVHSIYKCQKKKKHSSPNFFECVPLLVACLVPITIAVYTFVQNDNDQAIALANGEKDLEIAQNQRAQDLKIAEDQQKANILAANEIFLVGHLNRYAKLIVNDYNSSDPTNSGIISLEEADLSEISLTYRVLKYLSLPKVSLTRSLFAHADLSCVNFYSTILIDSDFTYTSIVTIKNHCFLKSDQYNRTIFAEAIMNNINLCHAEFIATDFTKASLIYANISYFVCLECLFVHKNMFRADLNFSRMTMYCNFQLTNLTEAILLSVLFKKATFIDTIFTRIQTIEGQFKQCSFTSIHFINCTFDKSLIIQSNFFNIYFNGINLRESIIRNADFMNISMQHTNLSSTIFDQCIFINVDFNDTILTNVTFHKCMFQRSLISNKEKLQVTSFNGSIFS